ncbi:MAG: hypothetical protein A3F35_03480 [Candidatus Woykebacteria bacterium RIFCSPHIGHO2_12_FULL_45_10]|uniref:Uncharacterized protein n=1 Tax=Candidatus Woykebacteria bacterium RIFCSPHIGHO2_12_FULL_45_10 TaxID=1802603 RepID=A0A1G1WSB0_9BACT|nr:MAG: hypothetical protein A3F35_03480 [Candidatus Woykebacteria bacterium RIFCSPHIGHO2_12_FULL_45_10]
MLKAPRFDPLERIELRLGQVGFPVAVFDSSKRDLQSESDHHPGSADDGHLRPGRVVLAPARVGPPAPTHCECNQPEPSRDLQTVGDAALSSVHAPVGIELDPNKPDAEDPGPDWPVPEDQAEDHSESGSDHQVHHDTESLPQEQLSCVVHGGSPFLPEGANKLVRWGDNTIFLWVNQVIRLINQPNPSFVF